MTPSSKKYIFTWIALGIITVASTTMLVIPSIQGISSLVKLILSFSGWILVISSSLFLFFRSSLALIQKESEKPSMNIDNQPTLERRKSSKSNTERLDIQSTARKIIRKSKITDDLNTWGKQLLNALVSELEIMSGIIYFKNEKGIFEAKATYALPHSNDPYKFNIGEGLPGQVALNQSVKIYEEIPKYYSKVFSGLGSGSPSYLAMIPIMSEEKCIAIIEIAGFRWKPEQLKQLFDLLSRDLSLHFNSPTKKENE